MDTGTSTTDFEDSAFWVKFTKACVSIFMSVHFVVVLFYLFGVCLFIVESKAAQTILCSPFGELLFIGIGFSVHFAAEFKDNYG